MLVDMVLVWNFIPVEDILGTDQINVLYGEILYFQLQLMKYHATGRNCINISGFTTVSTSLMIDFMVVTINHPHFVYINFSCVAVPQKTGNVLCGLLFWSHHCVKN